MKIRLKSKNLADARREVYGITDATPYKMVLGRYRVDDEHMEPCYYMFETREDHEAWLKNNLDEHQIVGSAILRILVRDHAPKYWFGTDDRDTIIQRVKDMYGCGASTAKWVFKELCHMYDKSRVYLNE